LKTKKDAQQSDSSPIYCNKCGSPFSRRAMQIKLKLEYISVTQERVLGFSKIYNTAGTYTLTVTGEISKTITITVKNYSESFVTFLNCFLFFI
jgi:hypothetical protein